MEESEVARELNKKFVNYLQKIHFETEKCEVLDFEVY